MKALTLDEVSDLVLKPKDVCISANLIEILIAYNKAENSSSQMKILSAVMKNYQNAEICTNDKNKNIRFDVIYQMYINFNLRKLTSYWTIPKAIIYVMEMHPNIVSF